MGGDLSRGAAGKAPTFLVAAMKDPIGGNLDRIQIIKGWLDAKGDVQEKVYDVAWSGDRKPDANGKLPRVGNTVDVENATWTNTIGAPELITVWKDPDFDAKQRAFYYVRVIEIPTPRWTAYDAKRFGIKPLPGHPDDHHRARLHLAHLVHALGVVRQLRARRLSRTGASWALPCECGVEAELGHASAALILWREPLLHFLVIGAVLFAYFQWSTSGSSATNRIVLTAGQIEQLVAGFTKTWKRPPTDPELKGSSTIGCVRSFQCRRAMAAGLDRGDAVIRRRLRSKFEFFVEDMGELTAPDEAGYRLGLLQTEPNIGLTPSSLSADILQQGAPRRLRETTPPLL